MTVKVIVYLVLINKFFFLIQLQKKMVMIHQELQNLKHKMDSRKHEQLDEDHKLLRRIEQLKEQFRELLVEMRKRKAAESELAMTFSEDDSTVSYYIVED